MNEPIDKPTETGTFEGAFTRELQEIGDYRIVREAGRGGMGIVYEAEQKSLGRRVALKVLRSHMVQDSTSLRRFEREARAAARLHHTNIVPVFGVGCENGIHFYVMQFIFGRGLDEVINDLRPMSVSADEASRSAEFRGTFLRTDLSVRELLSLSTHADNEQSESPGAMLAVTSRYSRPTSDSSASQKETPSPAADPPSLPGFADLSAAITEPVDRGRSSGPLTLWVSIAEIGHQVAEALEYAHRKDVLHRDIKPSNLMLDAQNTVWVLDFGLAKAAEQRDLTETGELLGTLKYMPPERLDGVVTAQGDIYSLGVTLYELLALRPAFGADGQPVQIAELVTTVPPRLDTLNPEIPRDLVTIVHKAIEPDPAYRYETAGEMADDLLRFIHDEPIHARALSIIERCARWSRRNRGLAAALGTVALLIVVIAVSSLMAARHFHSLSDSLEVARRNAVTTSEKNANLARRMSIQAQTMQQLAEKNAFATERIRREQAKTMAALETAESHRRVADDRSNALAVELALGDLQRGLLLCNQGEVARGMLWMTRSLEGLPHGYSAEERAIRLNLAGWQASLSRLALFVKHEQRLNMVSFTPCGTRVLAASDDGLACLWDAETGKLAVPPMVHPDEVRVAVASPDGEVILTGTAKGLVSFWSAHQGTLLNSSQSHTGAIRSAKFSPDGQVALTASNDKTARLWRVPTGTPLGPPLAHDEPVECVAISPDGQLAATGGWDRKLRFWNMASGALVGQPLQAAGTVMSIDFSPQGDTCVVASLDGQAQVWNVSSGQPVGALLQHRDEIHVVRYTNDGRRLLTASDDRTARVWDSQTGQPVGKPAVHSVLIRAAAFSHDGRFFLTGSDDHTAQLWETESGLPIGTPLLHQAVVRGVAFDPADTRILTGSYDGTARLWTVPRVPAVARHVPFDGLLRRVCFSADGSAMLAISEGDVTTVRSWQTADITSDGIPISHEKEAWALAFDQTSNRVATGGYDRYVRITDRTTHQPVIAPLEHPSAVHAAAFSSDRNLLVTGCRNHQAFIWDLTTGDLKLGPLLHLGRIYGVAFSADGSRVAIGTDNQAVQIWDALTGQPVGKPLPHQGMIQAVAFSPDSQTLATGSFDHTVRLWDATTAQPKGSQMVHRGPVQAVCFSPDSQTILTGSYDRTARVWNVATGIEIGPPVVHHSPVLGVAFHGDGRTYLSVSEDGELRTSSMPEALSGDVDELRTWVELATGMRLTSRGTVTVMDVDEWVQHRRRVSTGSVSESDRN
jgi:WD40 repeat protein/serine/threonine protein kinase